jgi:hypothetical protein
MKVEFHRSDDPDAVLATVVWSGGLVQIHTEDEILAAKLADAYRPTPVVTDDASYRQQGTHGEVVLQPGNLEWFRAASQVRAPAVTELMARLIPGVTEGGYDPAAGYRRFESTLERLESRVTHAD